MAKRTSKLLVSFALALITTLISKAQITFVKGYIINDKGDTLKGEVKTNLKKEQENYVRVTFKDASGTQKNYKPAKLKGYGYDNNHFISWGKEDEAMFYKRLTNGAILLFKSAFEVVVMNKSEWEFDYFLYKTGDDQTGGKTGKMTEAKVGKFTKQLKEWMKDAPEFSDDYQEKEKGINEQSAIDVIQKYNNSKK